MKPYQIAILLAILSTSCSTCGEDADTPSITFAEICPAAPPPPQDCFIPEITPVGASRAFTSVEEFRPICNSPCTKGDRLGINLSVDTGEAINTGNLEVINTISIATYDSTKYLRGFQNLKKVSTSLYISSESVQRIGALGKLNDVGQLTIQDCNNLEEFTEPLLIEDMSAPNKTIVIGGNGKLKNLKFLSNLKRIHYLVLLANRGPTAFSTLEGLENLEFAENLTITGNGNLTSLRALKNLKQVPNLLEFQSNNNLPKCEIDWLLAQLDARPKEVIIMNNGSNTATCPP